MMETVRSRFQKVFRGEKPADRLPKIEWAMWWHLTVERWQSEGLPKNLDTIGIKRHFGLDVDHQLWIRSMKPSAKPSAKKQNSDEHWIATPADYQAVRSEFYSHPLPIDREHWRRVAEEQARGESTVWITFEGFFWWPRVLFGIEPHLYAFYDEPELMHRINQDNLEFMLQSLEDFCSICVPDFMTFAEDMSYNNGPMISKVCFDEFLAPYYRQIVPRLKKLGIVPLIDSDGDVELMMPWLEEAGIAGILPLERRAGVELGRVRKQHPSMVLVGGFDKTVMDQGEAAIRNEFERLLPVMRERYYIPSVDHQTPPAVSMEAYRLYLKLLDEYCRKAVE